MATIIGSDIQNCQKITLPWQREAILQLMT